MQGLLIERRSQQSAHPTAICGTTSIKFSAQLANLCLQRTNLLQDCVKYIGNCWLPARIHVRKALEELASIDPSCQIMRLDVVCPWKQHLYTLEEEMGLTKPVLFCVYKDDREGKWRVQVGLH